MTTERQTWADAVEHAATLRVKALAPAHRVNSYCEAFVGAWRYRDASMRLLRGTDWQRQISNLSLKGLPIELLLTAFRAACNEYERRPANIWPETMRRADLMLQGIRAEAREVMSRTESEWCKSGYKQGR